MTFPCRNPYLSSKFASISEASYGYLGIPCKGWKRARISRWGVDVDVLVHGLKDFSNSGTVGYPVDPDMEDWPIDPMNGWQFWKEPPGETDDQPARFSCSRQDFDLLWAHNNLQQFFIITKLNWSHAPCLTQKFPPEIDADGPAVMVKIEDLTCQFCFTASRITSLSAINSGLTQHEPRVLEEGVLTWGGTPKSSQISPS